MRKRRVWFLLPVALAIILLGAYLPRLAAWVQDRSILGKASYSQVRTVELEIRSQMRILEKLSLMSRKEGLPVSFTSRTRQEAEELARTGLKPYAEAGLISAVPGKFNSCTAYLVQDPDAYGIVWELNVYSSGEDLLLILDDETGAILSIRSFSYRKMPEPSAQIPRLLDRLTELYFTGLGVENYQDYGVSEMSQSYVHYEGYDETIEVRPFLLGERPEEAVHLEFVMTQWVFYLRFP